MQTHMQTHRRTDNTQTHRQHTDARTHTGRQQRDPRDRRVVRYGRRVCVDDGVQRHKHEPGSTHEPPTSIHAHTCTLPLWCVPHTQKQTHPPCLSLTLSLSLLSLSLSLFLSHTTTHTITHTHPYTSTHSITHNYKHKLHTTHIQNTHTYIHNNTHNYTNTHNL